MNNPSVKQLTKGMHDNLSNDEYYGNFNLWMEDFKRKVDDCSKEKISWPTKLNSFDATYA
jgi:hypothetical protein